MNLVRLLPISMISAAMLAYEVLLIRLFSIVQWHGFAGMVISIALLGYGASGTVLALARGWLLPRYPLAFAASAALFAVSAVAGLAVTERLPFNALEVVWQPGQLVWLAAEYALLFPPFLFGAACIGLAFARAPVAAGTAGAAARRIGRIYAADLLGAAVGAIGILVLLLLAFPETALRLVAALGLSAAAVAALELTSLRARTAAVGGLGLAAVAMAVWLPAAWTDPRPHMSEYKGLMTTLLAPGTRVIAERSGPLGLLSVVESPEIPFRHAPGMSLANTQEPPAQLGVFTDGDGLAAITAFEGDPATVAYLGSTTSALPYALRPHPRVLVLGAGAGAPVLQAVLHDAPRIDAVEANPQMVALVAEDHAAFAGNIYGRPEVTVLVADARSVAAAVDGAYDVIQIPPLDSFGAAAAGVQGLHQNAVYTVEALRDYLGALAPNGVLAMTRWIRLPPRDTLKLAATAIAALEGEGAADPGRHLALVRGWDTATLLVAKAPLSTADIAAVRAFAADRSFDISWLPGLDARELNRYAQLPREELFEGLAALLGPDRDAFIDAYKFTIAPATDNRPYFYDFFRWRALPELMALRTQGGAAMLDWGYLILLATLAQAAMLSMGLILLPLVFRRRMTRHGVRLGPFAAYFFALGLAFLFVEIAFIQRFTLFLGQPLTAVAVVLAGFLGFAGLGSATATRWQARIGAGSAVRAVAVAAGGIVALALVYLAVLPALLGTLAGMPPVLRIAVALALIAPLAFCMGLPFPLGLERAGTKAPALVPWAWGVNGCASVLSAILATLLAMHVGFSGVVAVAAVLYLTVPLLLARWTGT